MDFSVVIPAYNSSKTLGRALESCLLQSYLPGEVIVVDDCGHEDMEEAFSNYKSLFFDKGIELIFKRLRVNSGASVARNEGWDISTCEYVAFLDSDDFWHNDKLKICSDVLRAEKCDLLFHQFDYVADSDERKLGDYSFRRVSYLEFLARNLSATACFLVRRDLLYRFDVSMKYTEDHDLWLRICHKHKVIGVYGPSLTFVGREVLSRGGLSSNKLGMRLGEIKMYYKFFRGVWFFLFPIFVFYSIGKHFFHFSKALVKG